MSYTKEQLEAIGIGSLRKKLNEIAYSKSVIAEDAKKAVPTKQKNQKKLVNNLIKKDTKKYEKYKIRNKVELDALSQDKVIKLILEIEKLPNLEQSDYEFGTVKRGKRAEQSDEIILNVKRISDKPASEEGVKELEQEVDLLVEIDKEDPSEENKARIKEVGELALEKVGELFNKEKKPELIEPLVKLFEKIYKEIPSNFESDDTELLDSKEELETIVKKNRITQKEMGQLAIEARKRREAANTPVKNPAVDMEEKEEVEEPVKMAPSGEMVSGSKGVGKKKQPVKQKEEPYTPLPVVGTDYRGSKEMFEVLPPLGGEHSTLKGVKPEQKPLEPFGGLQSQNEVEAPYLSTKSDKAIGDVRQVGFIGAQDQLAKVEDVTLEPSERSKSLKRFTNFRWVQSVQNSDLGYASPFQRMDDIDDRRRFGKCFMHANKMPKDPYTQEELDKAKGFNTYSLVPSFDMSSRMQPAGNLSFINSTSKFARKLTADEMEPINQGKRNVNNDKNKLEFTTILHSDDPLKRIKDKYKNNIIC
jgi:hypothetical protein